MSDAGVRPADGKVVGTALVGATGRRARGWAAPAITAALLLLVWEVAARAELVDPLFFAGPIAVAGALWRLITSGEILPHYASTMGAAVLGIGIAIVAGVIGGLAFGVSPAVARVASPYLVVLNATPRVALIGLFVIWLGLGLGVRVAMVAVSAFFPVFFNTAEGVRALDPALDRVGRAFGCTRREWFTRILLPHTAPWMLTGVQLAVGRGLVVVVIAEILVGSLGGVGYVIANAGQQLRPADVLAGAALMAVTGCALTLGLGKLGRWLAPWRP